MIFIANKIVQEKDEFGVLVDVNYAAEPFPKHAVRIVYDGLLNQWKVCENDQDVAKIMQDYPVIKQVVDEQKAVPVVVTPGDIDPL